MSEKYQFVADHVSQYAVALLCRVLGVARSGYYAWRKRAERQRSRNNRTLTEQIRAIHTASRSTYGSPRIHAELRAQGIPCSQKRVARVMRLSGITGQRVRQTRLTTDSHHSLPVAANTLNQEFHAAVPNTKWAGDITSIATGEGWLYLAVVMDLFSRRIIGWSMHATRASELVVAALQMALQRRGRRTQLVHHSDRGANTQAENTRHSERLRTSRVV